MADDFCFALLRSTTLQILQSVGFESVQLSSADTLTDVFGQYIEFLASTICDYSQLSGRSTGCEFDVIDGLSELSIDVKALEDWLELEGKQLKPAWSDQADPSCALEGIINVQKVNHDIPFVYEYVDEDSSVNEAETTTPLTPTDEDIDLNQTVSKQQQPAMDLPDYVPPYLPAFPKIAISKDEEEEGERKDTKEDIQPIPSAAANLPHPLAIKKKKKPITNPFTHITPFEESLFATEKDTSPPMALSALETKPATTANTTASMTLTSSSPTPSLSLAAQRDISLKRVMDNFEKDEQASKKRLPIARSLPLIFQEDTQDDAAAGTRLFGRPQGLLSDIVRKTAPRLALSTLSTPNLLVDVMTLGSESTALDRTSTSTASSATPHLITIPTKPATSGISLTIPARSIPSSTTTPTSAISAPSSGTMPRMEKKTKDVFDLDFGDDENEDEEDASPPSALDVHERQTTALSTSTSVSEISAPAATGTPISLASLANKNGNAKQDKPSRKLTINLSNLQKKSDTASPVSKKPSKLTISLPSKTPSSSRNAASPSLSTNPPSNRSVSSSPSSSATAPKIRFTLKPPEAVIKTEASPPLPPSSLSTSSPLSTASTAALSSSMSSSIKNISVSNTAGAPPLLSTSTSISATESADSSVTPALHHTMPSSTSTTAVATSTSSTSSSSLVNTVPAEEQEDTVRCICDHPTIDYGAFMIACDTCGVWYHGSCVGISELDQVEEWHCPSCQRQVLQ